MTNLVNKKLNTFAHIMFFDLTAIGYISKPYGFKGDVKVSLDVLLLEEVLPSFLFIYIDGKPVPFSVENMQLKNDSLIVSFEDVDDENTAQKLKNTSIYCLSKDFELFFEKEESLDDLIGFEVYDQNKGLIGKVDGVIENSIQPTLVLTFHTKEILIPYTEEIIKNISFEQEKIDINAPDGLIDMYLDI